MVAPSPAARRIAKPSWLDLRLVLGVVLVLGSVLVGAVVVSRAGDTHTVISMERTLAAGTVLRDDDLGTTQVQLPDDRRGLYVRTAKDAVGKTLVRAVSAGEILPLAAIGSARAAETVTIPLDAGAAPQLRKGERIEVWVSTTSCTSVVLLPDVVVQDVRTDTGSFGSSTGAQDVFVSVDPAVADRVAAALGIDQAVFRAGVLTGGQQSSPSPASTAPIAGQLPSDLASCASPSASR